MSLKKFFKRINTSGEANYIWKVVPKCRCGYSETPIAKRAYGFYPWLLQENLTG